MLKRSLPSDIPQSYRELSVQYPTTLAKKAAEVGMSVADLVEELKGLKLVEGFSIEKNFPKTFTWDAAVKYFGITSDQWHNFLVKASKPDHVLAPLRPNSCGGDEGAGPAKSWDTTAVYWGPDILRIADYMDERMIRRSTPRTCPSLVSAFHRRLHQTLTKVVSKDPLRKAPAVQPETWPKDLPRNPEELVKMYHAYVFEQVRRVSKIKTEVELQEVTQQVWFNIIQSKVLEKFVETALTKLPRTLTVDEVLNYLGITFSQWTNAMAYSRRNTQVWMPIPVKGTAFSRDALFLTEDIQTLDNSGFLEGRRGTRQHPDFTGRGFRSYLTMAVKNHFKNLLRTRSRRHKERGVEANTVLTSNSSGLYHRAYTSEEETSWEENLSSNMGLDMEDMLDVISQLRKYGVDPQTDAGREVLDNLSRGLTLKESVMMQRRQQTSLVLHA